LFNFWRNLPHIMEHKVSLPCAQQLLTHTPVMSHMNPIRTLPSYVLTSILILSSHLTQHFTVIFFLWVLPPKGFTQFLSYNFSAHAHYIMSLFHVVSIWQLLVCPYQSNSSSTVFQYWSSRLFRNSCKLPPQYMLSHFRRHCPSSVPTNVFLISFLFSERFLICRKIQRDLIINVNMSSCKLPVFCQSLIKLAFSRRFSKNTQTLNLVKIGPVVAYLFHADRETDRQTDRRRGRQPES
jgi:hypothetical protein